MPDGPAAQHPLLAATIGGRLILTAAAKNPRHIVVRNKLLVGHAAAAVEMAVGGRREAAGGRWHVIGGRGGHIAGALRFLNERGDADGGRAGGGALTQLHLRLQQEKL